MDESRVLLQLPDATKLAVGFGYMFLEGSGEVVHHTGILYSRDNGSLRFLHFPGNGTIEDEDARDFEDEFCWVVPDSTELRFDVLLGSLEGIARDLPNVPYAITCETNATLELDELAGTWTLKNYDIGFTCVSFVLTTLTSLGLYLVDTATWQPREADTEFQKSKLESIRSRNAFVAARLEEQVGKIRVRPAEAAGAAGCDVWPVCQEAAEAAAQVVLSLWPEDHVLGNVSDE